MHRLPKIQEIQKMLRIFRRFASKIFVLPTGFHLNILLSNRINISNNQKWLSLEGGENAESSDFVHIVQFSDGCFYSGVASH